MSQGPFSSLSTKESTFRGRHLAPGSVLTSRGREVAFRKLSGATQIALLKLKAATATEYYPPIDCRYHRGSYRYTHSMLLSRLDYHLTQRDLKLTAIRAEQLNNNVIESQYDLVETSKEIKSWLKTR